jgi:hypothetical protein
MPKKSELKRPVDPIGIYTVTIFLNVLLHIFSILDDILRNNVLLAKYARAMDQRQLGIYTS